MGNRYFRESGTVFTRGFWYKRGPNGEKIEVCESTVPDKQVFLTYTATFLFYVSAFGWMYAGAYIGWWALAGFVFTSILFAVLSMWYEPTLTVQQLDAIRKKDQDHG